MCACSCVHREEAARMWQRREGEWERERLARNRLMTEVRIIKMILFVRTLLGGSQVLAERQQQIGAKMEAVKEKQVWGCTNPCMSPLALLLRLSPSRDEKTCFAR